MTWEERQAEKQRSRDRDEEDLRTGRKTREQLCEENSLFRCIAREPMPWKKMHLI